MAIRRIDRTYRGKPTHHYEIDGERVDGVTTLLSKGLPKPALLPWGIRSVAEYAADNLPTLNDMAQSMGRGAIVSALKQAPYADRDEAAKRGTEIHAFAEDLTHGRPVEPPPELRGHVESCARFLDDWQVASETTEIVVASRKWRYAGSTDAVAKIGNDQIPTILDYKTSRSGIFGETALQLAAYAHAEVWLDGDTERPVSDLAIARGVAVWVRADGYDVYPVDITADTFKLFCHVAFIARRMDSLKTLVGNPISWNEAA